MIVPRRHTVTPFALTHAELREMLELVMAVRDDLDQGHGPDGFNIGMNAGAAAGQTVDHAHLHLIPRYYGDASDPRGGVRWVLPDRAAYWDQ